MLTLLVVFTSSFFFPLFRASDARLVVARGLGSLRSFALSPFLHFSIHIAPFFPCPLLFFFLVPAFFFSFQALPPSHSLPLIDPFEILLSRLATMYFIISLANILSPSLRLYENMLASSRRRRRRRAGDDNPNAESGTETTRNRKEARYDVLGVWEKRKKKPPNHLSCLNFKSCIASLDCAPLS